MGSKKYKIGLWFVIICNLLFVICFTSCLLFSFKIINTSKIINKEDYIKYMESIGCSVIDMSGNENFSNFEIYLENNKDSCPYQATYVVSKDDAEVNKLFNDLKQKVLTENNNLKVTFEYNFFNNFKEYYSSGDDYKVVVLNHNSIFYMSSNIENSLNIKSVFNYFGYELGMDRISFDMFVFSSLMMILLIMVAFYFIEEKMRGIGFIAFIPWYNLYCIIKDVFGSLWFFFLMIIPGVNIIFWYKLGRVFGKSYKYCLLMMLFPSVFAALIAFDDSYYTRPEKKKRLTLSNDESYKKENVIVKFFMRCLTVIFLLLSLICLMVWFEEKLFIYIILFIEFLIYSIFASPFITRYTKQFKKYTKIKPLLVLILIIIMFIAFSILPV